MSWRKILDECAGMPVERCPGTLLVSVHNDDDVHPVERTGYLQGLEGMDDDDVAPFMSIVPGPRAVVSDRRSKR